MKTALYRTTLCALAAFLISCEDQGKTTTVGKSLWKGDTIVSTPSSDGTFTRTQYGKDFWGNRTITVTPGHSSPSQQEDLLLLGLHLVVGIIDELSKPR